MGENVQDIKDRMDKILQLASNRETRKQRDNELRVLAMDTLNMIGDALQVILAMKEEVKKRYASRKTNSVLLFSRKRKQRLKKESSSDCKAATSAASQILPFFSSDFRSSPVSGLHDLTLKHQYPLRPPKAKFAPLFTFQSLNAKISVPVVPPKNGSLLFHFHIMVTTSPASH
ncbi:unnamed protein product [Lactuca virosa]|uniref:Uncharacterized protein n=1 Tax=Lactuca virosa TaxID=75947 RepID=A0AAU9PPE2_9ASTR|nr:unnamed protein product [Lactuca virosa]